VAVGGLLSGCSGLGGGGSNIDELTLLMEDVDDTQILDEISTQYEDETGVEITFETFPYGGLRETAVTQLRSPETEYDLMQIDTAWFGEFVEGGLLQPIDDRIDNSEAISRDVYTDPVWNAVGEYNGTAYALPFYNYAYGLLYRDDLINDEELQSQYESEYGESLTVPESVEEYVDTAIFMTRDTDGDGEINIWGTAMQGAAGISILDEWLAYFYALGGNYIQDGDVVFGDHIDTAVEAMELYQRQMENAAPEAAKGWGFNQASELMSNGEAFSLMTYNWLYQRLQDSDIGSQLGVSNVPGGKPILGAWGLGIPENIQSEARADAVWDFLTWAESSDIRKERASRGGAPTCVDTLTDEELIDQFPNHYPALRDMLENGVPLPNIPSAGQINDIIGTALNQIITGDVDTRETLTSAAEEMSSAVEE
jgi:ABC-type glycerol-3-phosphate transport system substrate-binding protein